MTKDPAFLFYSSDFLTGVSDLTMEERGQYITLLCLQHQKGHLSKKAINIATANATADVLAKFDIDNNGNYFNKRLDKEKQKRIEFSEKQRDRAKKGWEKRKLKDKLTNAGAMPGQCLLEDENDNDNDTVNENGLKTKFDKIRKQYPGTKRGLETEFKYFKKHKDWKDIIDLLLPAINKEIEYHKLKLERNEFVPQWKHFKTWIYNRSWEEEYNLDIIKKPIKIRM